MRSAITTLLTVALLSAGTVAFAQSNPGTDPSSAMNTGNTDMNDQGNKLGSPNSTRGVKTTKTNTSNKTHLLRRIHSGQRLITRSMQPKRTLPLRNDLRNKRVFGERRIIRKPMNAPAGKTNSKLNTVK